MFLKQSTNSQVVQTPSFVSDTDFKTVQTGLTIANTDVKIIQGGSSTNKNSGGGTHVANGSYSLTFNSTDTATVGRVLVSISVSGALPVFFYLTVLEEAVYDMLFGASAIGYIANQPVDVNTIKTQTVTCGAGVTVGAYVGNATAALAVDASGRVDLGKILGTASAGAVGYMGVDWGAVANKTTTNALTGTTIASTQKVDVDTIKTNPVVNAGTVTFPTGATLASTTNITGGTITTVTNLTNAPTAGDFTSTMKTSIGTAVAASAVASVTGNVGGNVTGSVGSVASGGIIRASFAADTGLVSIRSNTAQAGANGSITLDASASSVDDFYKNELILITGGTGIGQTRTIGGYTGSTKVATVSPNWATNPDNTSTFAILPAGAVAGASAPTATEIRQEMDNNSTQLAAIVADTNELQTDWTNGGRLDLLIDGVKAKTDSLTFTVSNQIDANVIDWKGATAPAMTGDAYARLGAPAGASVSADIAAIQADTNDIQTRIPAALSGGGMMKADVEEIAADSAGVAGLNRATKAITTGTVGSASTTTSIVTSAMSPSAAVTDQFKGLILRFAKDTTTTNLRGQATDITGSSSGGVLTVTALTTAPVSGDVFTIE